MKHCILRYLQPNPMPEGGFTSRTINMKGRNTMKSLAFFLIALPFLATTAFATEMPTLDDVQSEPTVVVAENQPEAAPAEPMAPAPAVEATVLTEASTDTVADPTPSGLTRVTEMVIATAIEAREPVAPGTLFSKDAERLVCHSRMASEVPTTITHVWYRNGEQMASIPLHIGAAASWRTWSSKAMFPAMAASWRVDIVAEDGTLLAQTDFTVE